MRSIRSGLASLRLQLIEPSVDTEIKSNTLASIKPVLIRILQVSSDQSKSARADEVLRVVYGGAIETADAMLRRHAGGRDVGDSSLRDDWSSGNDLALKNVVEFWQKQVLPK